VVLGVTSGGVSLGGKSFETSSWNPGKTTGEFLPSFRWICAEILCEPHANMSDSMRMKIQQAIALCQDHARAGTELPYALFAAGRLNLLLGDASAALGWYARGLRHLFDGESCVSESVLEDEVDWTKRIYRGMKKPPSGHNWIERLINLDRSFRPGNAAAARDAVSPGTTTEKRVLIVAGGAAGMDDATLEKVRPCLEQALKNFSGTVICGGTKVGIPGCVGELAAELEFAGHKQFELVGYIPEALPQDMPKDERYDRFVVVSGDSRFSPEQILRTWEDLQREGITPDQVKVIGFGGGRVATAEFHVALALGASVAVVAGSGGGADAIIADPVWNGVSALLALPLDAASAQAFVSAPTLEHTPEELEVMAQAFHAHYVRDNPSKLPENMRAWEKLADTYKKANIEQARHAVEILRAAGFDVRPATDSSEAIASFQTSEYKAAVERMAELEHGRWNLERLRDGWRFGPVRDNAKKIHNCLVAWKDLPEEIREYDRNSVRAFPEILAQAKLEIVRS
jgi:hypothetical protein